MASLMIGLVNMSSAAAVDTTAEHVVTSYDESGDVRLYGRHLLTTSEKKSVDLRRVTVQRVGDKARVIIRLRDVIRVRKFDQMLFVSLVERKDVPGGQWRTDAGFTTKGRDSYVTYSSVDGDRFESCNLDVHVRPRKSLVSATVPWRCTAEGPVKVSVESLTGTFRSDATVFSRDRHSISGRHAILP
ncbi:hypothetical protein K8W59_06670 [Nocardioides rotundus]|uniref:hypothetical protein n=1 Tax=Nocardioides rotundus TaxID=1774216 RepID=UPI001CBB1CCF|nr:hypothetical protein [Nocardioides rotundus]UAL31148.1 hypothetical protein K8W59_06670 [Nocardioides rotundus]